MNNDIDALRNSGSTMQDLNLLTSNNYANNKLEIISVLYLKNFFEIPKEEKEDVTHERFFGENFDRVKKALK